MNKTQVQYLRYLDGDDNNVTAENGALSINEEYLSSNFGNETSTPRNLTYNELDKTIQIDFQRGNFIFTKFNGKPTIGRVTSQEHKLNLLRRAMEVARDTNSKFTGFMSGYFIERFVLESVSDEDISIYVDKYSG